MRSCLLVLGAPSRSLCLRSARLGPGLWRSTGFGWRGVYAGGGLQSRVAARGDPVRGGVRDDWREVRWSKMKSLRFAGFGWRVRRACAAAGLCTY